MSEQKTHTLTVKHLDEDNHTITINHPTDGPCPHTWWACDPCPEPPPEGEEPWEWYEDARHGVEHQVFGGDGCVESNECYYNAIRNWHYPDDLPAEDGTYVLDYEGGDLDDSYLIVGAIAAHVDLS
jgi:hypothetical protein